MRHYARMPLLAELIVFMVGFTTNMAVLTDLVGFRTRIPLYGVNARNRRSLRGIKRWREEQYHKQDQRAALKEKERTIE